MTPKRLERLPATHLLDSVLDAVQDAILLISVEGTFLRTNRAAQEMFGYTAEEFLSLPVTEILPPDGREELARSMGVVTEGGALQHYASVLVRKDGCRFSVTLTLSPILDTENLPIGVSAVIQDRSRENETEGMKLLLETIVTSTETALYSTDLHNTITWWNHGAERLYGFTSEEIVGSPLRRLVPPEAEDETVPSEGDLFQGEAFVDRQTIRLTKGGKRIPVALTKSPITRENGQLMGAVIMARNLLHAPGSEKTFAQLQRLTGRERNVLGLVADGLQNEEIAKRLSLSHQTVKNYVSRILLKLQASTRTQAAAAFMAWRQFLED